MTEAPSYPAAFPAPVVLWSRPEEDRAGKPLLVLLHGYGANEQDLLSLADMLPEEFVVASLRAPLVSGPGFTWFPLTASIDYSLDAVKHAAAYAQDWIDSVRANHSSVTLLGFSMGMAMATTLLRHRPTATPPSSDSPGSRSTPAGTRASATPNWTEPCRCSGAATSRTR